MVLQRCRNSAESAKNGGFVIFDCLISLDLLICEIWIFMYGINCSDEEIECFKDFRSSVDSAKNMDFINFGSSISLDL